MILAGSTVGSTTFGGAVATSDAASTGHGGDQFEAIMWAEGVANTTAVSAKFGVNPVVATGGRGARVIVPQGTRMRASVDQQVRARGIINPSREELEALLLVL